jgi:anti-anti-sigma factor
VAVPPALRFELTLAKISRKTHVAAVAGHLDFDAELELRQRLAPLSERTVYMLIFDYTDFPFFVAAALELLSSIGERLGDNGGRLVVVSDDPKLGRRLDAAGFTGAIAFESSLAGAVERVGDGHPA